MPCLSKKRIVIKGSGVRKEKRREQTATQRQDTAQWDVLEQTHKGTGIIWSDRLTLQDGGTFVLTAGYWHTITASALMKPKYLLQDHRL
jgi:hypothetical protein